MSNIPHLAAMYTALVFFCSIALGQSQTTRSHDLHAYDPNQSLPAADVDRLVTLVTQLMDYDNDVTSGSRALT